MSAHRSRQRSSQQQHPRCRVQQILASHHMRDAQIEVVHGVGDKERRAAVAASDNEILDRSVRELDATSHDVVKGRHPVIGNRESDRTLIEVGLPCVEPALHGSVIEGAAFALADRLAIKIEPEPVEHLDDLVDVGGRCEFRVGVFDAQHQFAAAVTGVEPVEQRRTRRAEMRKPGGRRRESQPRAARALTCQLVGGVLTGDTALPGDRGWRERSRRRSALASAAVWVARIDPAAHRPASRREQALQRRRGQVDRGARRGPARPARWVLLRAPGPPAVHRARCRR